MTARAALLALAAAWLGLLVASWMMAGATFRTVDRVVASPPQGEAGIRLARVPAEDRRPLLRHLASEVNRWMFARFAIVQAALALAAAIAGWRMGGTARTLTLIAVAVLVVQAFLGSGIESLGRSIDFVPRPLPPAVGRRFGLLHAGYVGLDLVKSGVLVALVVLAGRRG